jgi:glycosyltransferase involved in cell wall biosynthesis
MVLCDFRVGGAEMAALDLVRALSEEGVSFTAAAVRNRGELGEAFAAAGADVHAGIARSRFDPLAPYRLLRLIRRRSPRAMLIVDVGRNAAFYGLTAAALTAGGMRRICWCHSAPGRQAGNFARWLRLYGAMDMLDVLVCPSEVLRRQLASAGLPTKNTVVIPNGVCAARFREVAAADLGLPAGRRLVVQVANVMPDKDFDTLFAAAALLAKRRGDFHLALVGRGTDSSEMRRRVEQVGIGAPVSLLGPRGDVPAILAAADVFVLSTRSEVMSLATLEAMAAGRAVVVSDVEAFDEVFAHEREGLKAAAGDPGALADALDRLLADDALRRRLARAGRRRADQFTLHRMAARFRQVLEGGGGANPPG